MEKNCLTVFKHLYLHAERTPDALALTVGDCELSYSSLLDYAKRIGSWLDARCANKFPRVGILASRSWDAYAGILGTWWVGGAYVPLNPEWPEERLANALNAAELDSLILDQQGLKLLAGKLLRLIPENVLLPSNISSFSLKSADKDAVVCQVDALPAVGTAPPKETGPNQLAYVMFTSGTTGSPKGVMVSVGNISDFLLGLQNCFDFVSEDRVSQTFELTFDLSVMSMLAAWTSGASLHVVPSGQLMGPSRFIREKQLSVWFSVPSTIACMRTLRMLSPGAFPSLRYSAFCGEPLPLVSAEAWHVAAPNSVVDNLYGPTEATVACLAQRYENKPVVTKERGIIAIGKPFEGMKAAIWNHSNGFLPAGQRGELVLSGGQVSRGYLNDASKTQERFPVINGEVWYLTGDFAYVDQDGIFHHLGRTDHQIKVLGNRVELEEIESHLREICETESVAAVAWPVVYGSAQGIVAFVSDCKYSVGGIRENMARRVPKYMVPAQILFLDSLPLTLSGKIDRKALHQQLVQG
jgi:D-alanine--poly(phosphoribitol) ligase subunit 1